MQTIFFGYYTHIYNKIHLEFSSIHFSQHMVILSVIKINLHMINKELHPHLRGPDRNICLIILTIILYIYFFYCDKMIKCQSLASVGSIITDVLPCPPPPPPPPLTTIDDCCTQLHYCIPVPWFGHMIYRKSSCDHCFRLKVRKQQVNLDFQDPSWYLAHQYLVFTNCLQFSNT